MKSNPLVLLFGRGYGDLMVGLYAYARQVGWRLQTIERPDANGTKGFSGLTRKSVRNLMDFWKPDGVIVDCFGFVPDESLREFGRVPHVFLNCDPERLGRSDACVACDSVSVARRAARELLSLGFENYAYVSGYDSPWARIRRDTFEQIVCQNGKRFWPFHEDERPISSARRVDELASWCVDLPKPCGVFAANDLVAARVIGLCRRRGVSIPDQVAVVGVDNSLAVCENADVSISSIPLDYASAGRLAGELLDDLMAGRKGVQRCRRFGSNDLVRRESSRLLARTDPRVSRAVEHIRQHACEGLTPSEVIPVMGCSRRFADRLFGQAVGHTILDEIHDVRLRRAKELLANSRILQSALPDLCGYKSIVDLCRVFKRKTGQTMRQYRESLSVKK